MSLLSSNTKKPPSSSSSSLKQTVTAIVTVLLFLSFQHNAALTKHYGTTIIWPFEHPLTNTRSSSHVDPLHYHAMTSPQPLPTLTLIDPHFLGGFRNQHMRFVSFVNIAVSRNISQILLPSLSWGDAYNKGKSLKHEYLFDVLYWNERAEEKGLPRLVRYDESVLDRGGCFNVSSGLWSGLDEGVLRHNETNLRHWDGNAEVGKSELIHCRGTNTDAAVHSIINNTFNNATTLLVPIGAGKGAGIFWDDYFKLQKKNQADTIIIEDRALIEQSIFQLLRPSLALHSAMEDAIRKATIASNNKNNRTAVQTKHHNHARGYSTTRKYRFMALHPRVEQEMMTHRCHVFMEQNLTRVFESIGAFHSFFSSSIINHNNNAANMNMSSPQQQQFKYDLIFVALSASEVEKPPRTDAKAAHLKDVMIGNRMALIHARHRGLFKDRIPIFESGASTAKQVRFTINNNDQNHHGKNNDLLPRETFTAESRGVVELVASIINFFTSVSADVFIGVRGSSFSTDVFAVRHYLSKEVAELHGGNYIIGPGGLIEELVGPPKVHSC